MVNKKDRREVCCLYGNENCMEMKRLRVGGLLLSSHVLMAPLAGYTCYPFRMLVYELGAGLCFTEMASANALKYSDRATRRLLYTTREEPVRAVQLLGGDPAVMTRMACSEGLKDFDIIDINMGCPVPNVFKSGEGSALMADPGRAAAIIRGVQEEREDCDGEMPHGHPEGGHVRGGVRPGVRGRGGGYDHDSWAQPQHDV